MHTFVGKTEDIVAESLDQLSKGLPKHLTHDEEDADPVMAEYSLANAKKAAEVRVREHMARLQQFDGERPPTQKQQHDAVISTELRSGLGAGKINLRHEDEVVAVPQPEMFRGKLKEYQLHGMNWLVNLYEQVLLWQPLSLVPILSLPD